MMARKHSLAHFLEGTVDPDDYEMWLTRKPTANGDRDRAGAATPPPLG